MRRGKFSTERILSIVKELESGVPIAELSRTHGVHEETIRVWKHKFTGMQGQDVQRLRQLTDENSKTCHNRGCKGTRD